MLKHDLTYENLRRGLRNPFSLFDEIFLQNFYRVPSTAINSKLKIGTNVFEKEWDVLIILDTCRVDALRSVAGEYSFLEDIESMRSVGGATPEWIAKTFIREYSDLISDTDCLTTTAQFKSIVEERMPHNRGWGESHIAYKLLSYFDTIELDTMGDVEYLFEYDHINNNIPLGHPDGHTPPKYVTDRAIEANRNGNFDRYILHYLQPHAPYVATAQLEGREVQDYESPRPLSYLRETGSFDKVWEAYLNELRSVLDEVEVLLENIDAEKVAITADHGEAFGEFGIYGHAIGSLHPKVRQVPWATTSASDKGKYEPKYDSPEKSVKRKEESTEKILKSLGYKF